jgi:glycosyltransferase involved in cell wall biosynthesis
MGTIKSIAVCPVRDAEDIIAFSVLHHLLAGVDRCIVVDNGSNDLTAEILKAIERKTGRLTVIHDSGPFDQAKIANGVVNEFTERGETLVIRFDADEFWSASVTELTRQIERTANVLSCEVLNFIQSRAVAVPSWWSWLRLINEWPTDRAD